MHLLPVVNLAGSVDASRLVDVHETRGNVQAHLEIVGNLEVKVGAEVETVVEVVAIDVVALRTEILHKAILVKVAHRGEIGQTVGTAGDVDIDILLPCRFVEHLVIPVHIGMTVRVAAVGKFLNVVVAPLGCDAVVGISLIDHKRRLVGIEELGGTHRHLHTGFNAGCNRGAPSRPRRVLTTSTPLAPLIP